MNRYAGKVALVTAGASGIGRAAAEGFAREGARVVLGDINDEGGEQVAEGLRAEGLEAIYLHCDATSEADVQRLVGYAVDEYGGLDIAANVVGDVHPQAAGPDLHALPLDAWRWTVGVTLDSAYLCLKHEIAYMREHGGGAIANVSSLAAYIFTASTGPAYGSSKAAIIQLTRFAAVRYAADGIRVNCIAPGVTVTPAFERAPPGLLEELASVQPISRPLQPSEQADGILWLCSDAAQMVTGHCLPIDGGLSATGGRTV